MPPSPADSVVRTLNERWCSSEACNASKLRGASFSRCSSCMAVFYRSSTCQRADWPRHKDLCKKQTALRQRLNTSEAEQKLATDFDAWQSAMGAMLYSWICIGALELSKYPENIHSKFIVLVLRTRTPRRPNAVLKMFEYIDIYVFDRAEHSLRIRGKPSEGEFQTMLEVTKEADDLAKRQGMLGAALVITDIVTSDGARGLMRGTPVLLRPSALESVGDDWEIGIKAIINEGLSIKEIFRAHEIAGTLPPPRQA
ncbi:hypothetical protein K438DRAFT_1852541 [Mycena galopus ATCC 62051]|nr:hypothetical protein K438DRAFT_1852541 [Mycena galopus ATCC 62051]